jgi:hypothetical protein
MEGDTPSQVTLVIALPERGAKVCNSKKPKDKQRDELSLVKTFYGKTNRLKRNTRAPRSPSLAWSFAKIHRSEDSQKKCQSVKRKEDCGDEKCAN